MSARVRVCPRRRLTEGVQVASLPNDELGRPREALVLLDRSGAVRAYLNRCRHLPIPLDGGSRKFLTDDGEHLICGTHGARYRRDDGLCIEGPCAGASLHAIRVHVGDDDWVELEL